jgi:ATP synthase protein I
MSETSENGRTKDRTTFSREVGAKAARKLRAQRHVTRGVWFGLGAALGIWLDKRHPGTHSWTLALLVAGLAIGCLNAWHWVSKEDKEMREEQENHDE